MATFEQYLNQVKASETTGGGAKFLVYISPLNDTPTNVTEWSVTFKQGDWSGTITSKKPTDVLQTPNLSGLFDLEITGSGPHFTSTTLKPGKGDTVNIGCNSNCLSIVKIVSLPEGKGAYYSPTWDAVCS